MSTTVDEQERFDQWSATYEHSFMQWLIFDRVHRAILRQLPEDSRPSYILDIGCGTGRLLRRMHTRWPDAVLIGVDPSEGMVAKACQLTPYATFYQATAEQIPVQNATLDLVTTTMSFHHWSNQTRAVIEIFRVLRPGGIFILADTTVGHGHPLSKERVSKLFLSSGFSMRAQKNIVPFLAISVGRK